MGWYKVGEFRGEWHYWFELWALNIYIYYVYTYNIYVNKQ